jgi:hypothetical protein
MEKKRRHVTVVVTEESIAKEIEFVLNHLAGAERALMPVPAAEGEEAKGKEEEERRRRQEIIGDAAKRMFVAGLLCLKASKPRQYSALATAAMRYVREKIEHGTAAFTVRKPRGPKAFGEWMLGTSILAAYEEIVRQLQDAWTKPPSIQPRPLPAGFGRNPRYGKRQYLGTLRRQQRDADRVDAVKRDAEAVLKMPVSDRLARQWVVELKTPARIALMMLGRFCKRSPRAMKDLLNQARKQLEVSRNFDRIAAARGLQTASGEPVGASELATTEDRRI